jgi:hypothetical protein
MLLCHFGQKDCRIAHSGSRTLRPCNHRDHAAGLSLASFCIVLTWWLSLRPSNRRDWRPDVAQTAWTENDGDRVTIHNLRTCDYRTETEYMNCWHDRRWKVYERLDVRRGPRGVLATSYFSITVPAAVTPSPYTKGS